jgi:hypothetical protein
MLNNEQNPEECDTTGDDSSNADETQNQFSKMKLNTL